MKEEIHKTIFKELFFNILPDILTSIFDDAIAFSMLAEMLAKASEKALKPLCDGKVNNVIKRAFNEMELGIVKFEDSIIEVLSSSENVTFPTYAVYLGVIAGAFRACGLDVKIVTNPARLKLLPKGSMAIYLDQCHVDNKEKVFKCVYKLEKI